MVVPGIQKVSTGLFAMMLSAIASIRRLSYGTRYSPYIWSTILTNNCLSCKMNDVQSLNMEGSR